MDITNIIYKGSKLPWNKSDINCRVKFVLVLWTEQTIWSTKCQIFLLYF